VSVCPQCGTIFSCCMVDTATDAQCWCGALPALAADALLADSDGKAASCLCPDCLRARIAARHANPQADFTDSAAPPDTASNRMRAKE
jgi:hypothetical protein